VWSNDGLSDSSAYAAVDLGAESGRVIVGRLQGSSVTLEPVHRFPNTPVTLPDGLHWNLVGIFEQVLSGIGAAAASAGELKGVGVDAWGLDYALFDADQRMLGTPFHYRDARTDGTIALAHERVSRADMYSVAGIQTMPINSVFQLLAEESGSALASAERIALIPDVISFWLTGELVNEATAASTTGLLDARNGRWARELVSRLRLPPAPFAIDPLEPGVTLAPVLPAHSTNARRVDVHLAAGHDTASAFVAAPVRGPGAAILSSGTWSLLGIELEQPVLTDLACACNLSNERGIDGTTRLLANVMGLWLVQECLHQWQREGRHYEYGELARLAAASEQHDAPLFDPDHESLLAPGDMPARIAAVCRAIDQRPPGSPGELVLAILVSLACKYRLVLERLERATGREISVVHVIGGGARNELLCRLTARLLARPVVAGPIEATALGNVLVQARATGELGSLAELRAVAAQSAAPVVYEPDADMDDTYARFLEATGCAVEPLEREAV
jgi:rhamnulokinase